MCNVWKDKTTHENAESHWEPWMVTCIWFHKLWHPCIHQYLDMKDRGQVHESNTEECILYEPPRTFHHFALKCALSFLADTFEWCHSDYDIPARFMINNHMSLFHLEIFINTTNKMKFTNNPARATSDFFSWTDCREPKPNKKAQAYFGSKLRSLMYWWTFLRNSFLTSGNPTCMRCKNEKYKKTKKLFC